MKLVRMPRDLLHLEDADLDGTVEPALLARFRAWLPGALDERAGLAILGPDRAGTERCLMLAARRVGASLRDRNIARRDGGGDRASGWLRLCYLPGTMLPAAVRDRLARAALANEAACFVSDLDAAWSLDEDGAARDTEAAGPDAGAATVIRLLDERLAGGRPTFLTADPERLPPGLETALRARLPVVEGG